MPPSLTISSPPDRYAQSMRANPFLVMDELQRYRAASRGWTCGIFSGRRSAFRSLGSCCVRDRPIRSAASQASDHANKCVGRQFRTSILWDYLDVGNCVVKKLGVSRRKVIGFQHDRDDIPVGGFAERVRRCQVPPTFLLTYANRSPDCFLRETLPEWSSVKRPFARRRERKRQTLSSPV